MPRHAFARPSIALSAIGLAVLAAGCAAASPSARPSPVGVPSTDTSATAPPTSAAPSQNASPDPSVEPSPGTVSVLGASGSGAFGPGTYATAFRPALAFTLADETILGTGGTIAYESIGETDVNTPGWVGISFGFDKRGRHDHGTWSADFNVVRIDKVFDPRHANKLIDAPKDFASWLAHHPSLTLADRPKAVPIGGVNATQLDVVAGDAGMIVGPIPGISDPPAFGFGPRQPARLVVATVEGHTVLITLGGFDGAARFPRVVAALQPLVESIVWG